MNPRQLKHRISLLEQSIVEDELGQRDQQWPESSKVWAAIKTMQGREYFEAAATQNENTVRFIVRYMDNVNPNMRIQFNGKTYDITSVINDDEANKTLTIIAKEGGQNEHQ